jgi:hypothetical protein
METVTDLGTWLGLSGLSVRTLLLAVGVALLLAGSRHYRIALILPAAALGAVLVDTVLGGSVPAGVRVLAAGAGAVGVGVLAALLEGVAVRLAGLVLGGGLVLAVWPAVMGGGPPAPWWLPIAGGLAGLLMFPALYQAALRLVVPLLAGLIIAHAVGRPGHPLWVLGPAVLGFALDAALLRRKTD